MHCLTVFRKIDAVNLGYQLLEKISDSHDENAQCNHWFSLYMGASYIGAGRVKAKPNLKGLNNKRIPYFCVVRPGPKGLNQHKYKQVQQQVRGG